MSDSKQKLKEVLERFVSSTFFVPVIGAEIEFCALDADLEKIKKVCSDKKIDIWDVKKEEGDLQWEVSIAHKPAPIIIASSIMQIRQSFNDADFSAMPSKCEYGNSLQIHVSLLNKDFKNIFEKNGEDESEYMKYSVGGLLKTMPENMNIFAPYDKCYERFEKDRNAPSTISWGGNNRTVAIRLPATSLENHNRRIEHRVAAADCDPYLVIAAILDGILYGLLNKIMPETDKIYGDASLEMYDLTKLSSCNI
jgi:glutamine synthetase